MIEGGPNGVRFRVLVTPGSGRNEVRGVDESGAYRVRVKAPPVDGRANEMLVAWFAKLFGIRKSAVRLTKGATGRRKTIEIEGVSVDQVRAVFEGSEET